MRSLLKLFEKIGDFTPKNKWVNLTLDDLKKDPSLADDFIELIKNSYVKIGGHSEFASPLSFFNGDVFVFDAIDVDDDPEADAVKVQKITPYGKKLIASASDGGPSAKSELTSLSVSSLKKPGYYAEVSDALAHVLITRGHVPFVGSEVLVRKILGNKDIKWIGAHPENKYPGYDGWYERKIGGKAYMKIMVGIPKS